MLSPKTMFTSAAVEAYSLTHNNRELRPLLLKSEPHLAYFLNVDDTDTVIIISGTRTQCSNDDFWASDSIVGSRGRKTIGAAADGRCRVGSVTLNCCLPHLSWVQQVSVRLISPVMQHNVVWKVRHNVTQRLHGPMQNLVYPTASRYWCNCKALKIRIWTNSCIRDRHFNNISPQCNKRWDERYEMDKKGKNAGVEKLNAAW